MLQRLEENPEVKTFIQEKLNMILAVSTISNNLDVNLFTIKKFHHQNERGKKQLRRTYVIALNQYIQDGKEILWIDETNFNFDEERGLSRFVRQREVLTSMSSAPFPARALL